MFHYNYLKRPHYKYLMHNNLLEYTMNMMFHLLDMYQYTLLKK